MSRCDNYLGHATHVTCRGIGRPSLRDTAEREKTIGFFVCPHRHAREPQEHLQWAPAYVEVWDGDHDDIHPDREQVAHYYRFQELKLGRRYRRGDTPARASFASLSGRRMVERAGCVPVALPPDADLRDLPFALLTEREQVAVDEVGMRGGEAVREARIVDFNGPFDQPC